MGRKKIFFYKTCLIIVFTFALIMPAVNMNAATSSAEFQKFDAFPTDINYEQIRTPQDMTFDLDGNKYVVDANAVIKYDAAGNYVMHWGDAIFMPIAIAIDEANRLYVAELFKVSVFDQTGTLLSSFGEFGSGNGQFDRISDIVVDDLFIYISDTNNHRVQIFDRIDNTFITQIGEYGTGDGQFNTPFALDVDDDHHLYVIDRDNHRIQLFEYAPGPTWTWGSKQGQFGVNRLEFLDPVNIYVEQIDATNTNLHVYDYGQKRIQRIPVTNHDISIIYFAVVGTTDIVDDGFHMDAKTRVTRDPFSGHFYIINQEIIARIDDPQNMSNWIGVSADQFNTAEGLAVDQSGNYYVTDYRQHRILKYDRNGHFLFSWGTLGTANSQFMNPAGVAIDSSNNIFIADHSNHRVQKFTADGVFVSSWGSQGIGNGEFDHPYGIAIDANDDVYVSSNNSVQKFTQDGAFIAKWGNPACDRLTEDPCKQAGNFSNPRGIAIDSDDHVYVADRNNHRVQKFASDGTFIEEWGKSDARAGNGPTEFSLPSWIAVDHLNRVHVADFFNNRIQILTADGHYITQYGDYPHTNFISAIAQNADGHMAVVDNIQSRINLFRETQPITDLTAVGGEQSATLHFTAPIGARTVIFKQAVYGTGLWSDAAISGPIDETATSVVVTGLADGTTYSFYVFVFGGLHEGVSNETTATTNAAPVPLPIDPDSPVVPDPPPADPDPPVDTEPPVDPSDDPGSDESEQSAIDEVIDFTDITGHWAEDIIISAVKEGFIEGYPNQTFQPDRNVTRAEFVAFIAKIKGWAHENALPLPYIDKLDIPKWAQGYIAQATQENIVYGYGDGTFKAEQNITRAEAVAILTRERNEPPATQMDIPFKDDKAIPAWAKGNVYAAANSGLIVGRGHHYFHPNEPITRAESVVLLMHIR